MSALRDFIDDPVIRVLALCIAGFILFAKLLAILPHRCPARGCGETFPTHVELDRHIERVHFE